MMMKRTLIINGIRFPFIFVEGNSEISSFWIGETPVTQEQYKAVVGENPSYFIGDNHPVEMVSWNACQEFIDKIKSPTKNIDFPTEKQWKFAAQGGNKSKGYTYAGSNDIDEVAWYSHNSGYETHPVKDKQANELGLYDITGNVWEWTKTRLEEANYVLCGGGWNSFASYCCIASRLNYKASICDMGIGFRLVINL